MSLFNMELENLLKTNPTIQEFKKQFDFMQKTILDLEHRMEELEKKIKNIE